MPDKGPFFAPLLPGMRQRFGGGRFAPPGTIAYAENARFRRERVEKRGGTVALGALSGTRQLWMADGYACVDDAIHAYDAEANSWTAAGRDSPITPIRRWPALLSDDDTITWVTCAQFGDSVIVAGSTQVSAGSASSILIRSFTRDGVAKRSVELTARNMPRLLVNETGNALYLFWRNSAGALVMQQLTEALALTGATLTAGSPTNYDVCVIPGQAPDAICVAEHAGGNITVRRIEGVTQTHSTTIISAGTTLVACHASSGAVIVAHINSTGVIWAEQSPSTAAGTGLQTVQASTASLLHTSTSALAAYSESASVSYIAWGRVDLGTAPSSSAISMQIAQLDGAGAVTADTLAPDWLVASRFYPTRGLNGTDLFLLARNQAGRCAHMRWQRDSTTVMSQAQIVGHVFDRDTLEGDNAPGGSFSGGLALDAVVDLDASQEPRPIYIGLPWFNRAAQRAADVLAFSERGFSTVSSAGRRRDVFEIGPARYIGGGGAIMQPNTTPHATLGAVPHSEGISNIPTIWAVATAGAGLTSGTVYSYRCVYEHSNEYGERVRSAPSAVVTASPSAGNLQATIRIQSVGGTYRPNLVAHLYRSWSGGPYYRVTPDSGAPVLTGNNGGYLAITQSYNDTMSDATASSKERLYTDLGYLPNAPATGARLTCEGGGRLFAVDNLDRIRFSKLYIPGEPVQFVDDPTFMIVPPRRPTGLAYLDGTLVIFSERGIHLVAGDGPDDTGQGLFTEPRALPTDDGCSEPRSVVVCSAGVLYQSRRGIMLLPRGFGPPVWVGADCQETLRDFPVIQGACRSSAQGSELVHFHVALDNLASYGGVLVFDPQIGAWSFDRMTPESQDSVVCVGPWFGEFGFCYLGLTPRVLRDDGTIYEDLNSAGAAVFYATTVELAELRPFGEIGEGVFTEVVLAGELTGVAGVTIETSLDEGIHLADSSQPETRTWTWLEPPISTNLGKALYLYATPQHGKGTALRVTIYDVDGNPARTAGPAWYAVGVDARPSGGLRRAGSGERK